MVVSKENLPHILRKRIVRYAVAVFLIILVISTLLGASLLQSTHDYQKTLSQFMQINQIESGIRRLSKQMEDRVVNGEDNLEDSVALWENLGVQIGQLCQLEYKRTRLLAEDLKAYHQNTAAVFFALLDPSHSDQASDFYQQFSIQQEDRQFLCTLLINALIADMSETYPQILQFNHLMILLTGIVIICSFIAIFLFSYTLTQNIYRPMQMLVIQAGKIMEGNYQAEDLPVIQQDEFGYLTIAFNKMKNCICDSFQSQEAFWKLETLLQDAEYRALQSQVNPHFLFNVLTVATEAALVEGAEKTVDIIENISYMLHYSLTSVRENTSLTEELKMVRSYIFLQQMRFGSRISFRLALSEALPDIRIPGMTIQPLVENAVMHGVEHLPAGGEIVISVRQAATSVEVCICDNGCGIPKEQLVQLMHGAAPFQKSTSTGLGIANVRNRMNSYYHRPDLMKILSDSGAGTSVYLNYPIQGETPYVSCIDC